jgi:DNA-binding PadR family transcriptional regulator
MTRNEEFILLTVLKLQGQAYGVGIRKQILRDTGHIWSFASIYQPLDNLVRKKWVRRIKGPSTAARGGKSKFFYEVTPEGIRNLRNINETHRRVWSGVPAVLPEKGQ